MRALACLSSKKIPPFGVALWANTPVKYYGGLPPWSPCCLVFAKPSRHWCFRRSLTPKSAILYSRPPYPVSGARFSPALRAPAPTRLWLSRQPLPSLAAGVLLRGGAASGWQRLPPFAPALGSQSPCARAGTPRLHPSAPTPGAAFTCSGGGCNSTPSPLSPSPPGGGGACDGIKFMNRYRWMRRRHFSWRLTIIRHGASFSPGVSICLPVVAPSD